MPFRTLMGKSRGEEVRLLQRLLFEGGFKAGPVDGVYGFLTESGVMSFQRAKGLPADGIVGPKTWNALLEKNKVLEQKNEINLMPFSNNGGRGKAIIDPARSEISVICWAMPLSGQFEIKPLERFSVWLANSEENRKTKIGDLNLDGLEYKIEGKGLQNINDYNLILVIVEKKDTGKQPFRIPVLIGSY